MKSESHETISSNPTGFTLPHARQHRPVCMLHMMVVDKPPTSSGLSLTRSIPCCLSTVGPCNRDSVQCVAPVRSVRPWYLCFRPPVSSPCPVPFVLVRSSASRDRPVDNLRIPDEKHGYGHRRRRGGPHQM